MRLSTFTFVFITALWGASAQNSYKGFNTGSTFNDGTAKQQIDFNYEMQAAKQLPGASGKFNSVRLYTMIQARTTDTPISAIPAAIETDSTLLLGLWASTGSAGFQNEINALKKAIVQYGTAFTDRVTGISVGSEDLYRLSIGEVGAQPSQIIDFIHQTRNAIAGTSLQGKPIGHGDTWTAFVNASNNVVTEAIDFLGMDAYPYYQPGQDNSVQNAKTIFYNAYQATTAKAMGKPVWVTETGWPVTGSTDGRAMPSAENARVYWEQTICSLMASGVNLYYFNLQSAQYGNPDPDWGVKGAGNILTQSARYSVTCPGLNVY
ncbi:glycoside hydrolase superfamily [Lophiotrema nucula]|uniref:Probable glucan endo-1,3-beta-glucosidase eglC n=1 Tax=Lophiotrema nucula TaxID=690887 RepID=A0A6A5YW73_9PLEO|nr:glycoside hydrolase superfamily [Lophiotrema nucula]